VTLTAKLGFATGITAAKDTRYIPGCPQQSSSPLAILRRMLNGEQRAIEAASRIDTKSEGIVCTGQKYPKVPKVPNASR